MDDREGSIVSEWDVKHDKRRFTFDGLSSFHTNANVITLLLRAEEHRMPFDVEPFVVFRNISDL